MTVLDAVFISYYRCLAACRLSRLPLESFEVNLLWKKTAYSGQTYHSVNVQAVHTIQEDLAVILIATSLLLHSTHQSCDVFSSAVMLSHCACQLQYISLVLSFTRRFSGVWVL